jgi:hypothetical protein
MFRYVISLLIVTAAAGCAVGDDLVKNGSFELPNVGETGIISIDAGKEPADFGWVVEAGDVEVFGQKYDNLPGASKDGIQHLDLVGVSSGTISQKLKTKPQTKYVLRFWYSNNYAWTNKQKPATADVDITGTVGGNERNLVKTVKLSHGDASKDDLKWVEQEIRFTALGEETVIRFKDTVGEGLGGILLDNVSVKPAKAEAVKKELAALKGTWKLRQRTKNKPQHRLRTPGFLLAA